MIFTHFSQHNEIRRTLFFPLELGTLYIAMIDHDHSVHSPSKRMRLQGLGVPLTRYVRSHSNRFTHHNYMNCVQLIIV